MYCSVIVESHRTANLNLGWAHLLRVMCFPDCDGRISPRANFFAFMGDRYGAQFLPVTLDKNEYMAICGSLMEDDDDDMLLLALYQKWCVCVAVCCSAL